MQDAAALASGSFASRLAILSGESAPSTDLVVTGEIGDYALPDYFDGQAAKVQEIAKRRQAIMEKRLANMRIEQPEAELQAQAGDGIFVGSSGYEGMQWYAVGYPRDEDQPFQLEDIPETVLDSLLAGRYAEVISSGFNVVTTRQLENIDENALVNGAVAILARRYTQDKDQPAE